MSQKTVGGQQQNNKQTTDGIVKRNSLKEQRINATLDRIISEMAKAMWAADRDYIARSTSLVALTPHMRAALDEFQAFCADNYGR